MAEGRNGESSPEIPQASPSEAARQAAGAEGKPERAAQEGERAAAAESTEGDESQAGAAGHGAEPRGKRSDTGEATFLVAIAEALWEEMERDDDVFLLGEDIGIYGGAFKVTEGFIDRFGPERVMDTPICEETIIGTAIGAALAGMRPVAELQYADFIANGFDELVNVGGKHHYRTGEAVPMVVRGPSGGGVRASAFHSQNPEPWFAHTPGLKVVIPAFPSDAKGLLKSAIRDDNPVVFFEHKWIYRRIKEALSEDPDFTVPIGKADIKRGGDDVSIIAYGAMVHKALEAAHELDDDGISTEVLDLRTVWPLDTGAILRTVEKTSRAVVLYESHKAFGIGAEVSAILAEDGFDLLDAPVVRVAPPNVPVPFSPSLEDAYLPQVEEIVESVRTLSKW